MFGLPIRAAVSAAYPGGARARMAILIFHRVLPEPDPLLPDLPDVARFRWQMQLLADYFRPLPLAEAAQRLAGGDLPPRSVCVTFDDGYRDNLDCALPVLEQFGIPVTVFVATGFLGDGMMFNDRVVEGTRVAPGPELDLTDLGLGCYPVRTVEERRAAIDQLLPALKYLAEAERDRKARVVAERAGYRPAEPLMLDADGVRAMAARGVTIGAHTLTHPILAETPDAVAAEEISASKRVLEEMTGQPVTLFAYPNGRPGRDYGDGHVQMVKDAGFQAAVSTRWAPAMRDSDPFQLPRFTPWDVTPGRFLARLLANGLGLVRQ